jgi:hypothetical protein
MIKIEKMILKNMKKLGVITSVLIGGVVVVGSTITMTSCKTNDSK